MPRTDEKKFLPWLHGQELLARFPGWKSFKPDILNWLWRQRTETGLWDLGTDALHTYGFPLSESWRQAGSRTIDFSVRVLSLLQRYFD